MNMKLYKIEEIVGDKKKGITGLIPMSKQGWYKGMAAGRYPRPIKISQRGVAWPAEEIEALITRLKKGDWEGTKGAKK